MAVSTPITSYNAYGLQPIPTNPVYAQGAMMSGPVPQTNYAIGDIMNAIREVQRNPSGFSAEEIARARELSMQYLGKDIDFPDSVTRTLGNAAFDFVDSLAFGLIPDKIGPHKLTSADDIAGMIGSTAALFTPGIGPMAVGTKIAEKILPSVAKMGGGAIANVGKVAGEGAGAAAVEGIGKGAGKIAEWLKSPMAAARLGSAIGGGFNFEDGINPMGAVLGALFPMGAGSAAGKAVSKADDAVAGVAGKIDEATATALNQAKAMAKDDAIMEAIKSNPVMEKIANIVGKRGSVSNVEAAALANDYNVTINEVFKAEQMIKEWRKVPRVFASEPPARSDYIPSPINQDLKAEVSKVMDANAAVTKLDPNGIASRLSRMTEAERNQLISEITSKVNIPPDKVMESLTMLKDKFPNWKMEDLMKYFLGQ